MKFRLKIVSDTHNVSKSLKEVTVLFVPHPVNV